MKYVWDFVLSTPVKRFAWITLAGFLGLTATYVTNLNFWWQPLVIALIAGITRYINDKYSDR